MISILINIWLSKILQSSQKKYMGNVLIFLGLSLKEIQGNRL